MLLGLVGVLGGVSLLMVVCYILAAVLGFKRPGY